MHEGYCYLVDTCPICGLELSSIYDRELFCSSESFNRSHFFIEFMNSNKKIETVLQIELLTENFSAVILPHLNKTYFYHRKNIDDSYDDSTVERKALTYEEVLRRNKCWALK